jgi:hypothetical protein
MNELNNLIDLALEKAKQDLNNEKVEVNYTPEFIIELLEEIKEVANAKPKDEYEIEKTWSLTYKCYSFLVYKNGLVFNSFDTIEEAKKYVASREEVANV